MSPLPHRIALLTDVHANLPALEAVLGHAASQGVDEFWDAGDSLGYGAFPGECLELLGRTCRRQVLGNYDAKVLKVPRRGARWAKSKHPLKWEAFRWTWEQLKTRQRERLASLPHQVIETVAGHTLVLRHAVANALEELEDGDQRTLIYQDLAREYAALDGPVVVLGGHLHHPYVDLAAGKELALVVAGPVGRALGRDPRAHYTVLELSPGSCQATAHRVSYDTGRAADAIRREGQPEAFAVMVEKGIGLEEALAELR
jgi:diadenosine tetraphosphatase ApaH/serine/threonine PP2A family protein phosphatase|nr:metallophosphoesterase [Candidatus Krumholzibacteria bacterium]